jgi:hypothetical protein
MLDDITDEYGSEKDYLTINEIMIVLNIKENMILKMMMIDYQIQKFHLKK